MDLNTGRVRVMFQPGATAEAAHLRDAVTAGGFTPVTVEMNGVVYEAPTP